MRRCKPTPAPGYHEHGFAPLDDLARRMGVRMTVHGHQHDCIDSSARWAEQGFESYGVGLRGVMAWQEPSAEPAGTEIEMDCKVR